MHLLHRGNHFNVVGSVRKKFNFLHVNLYNTQTLRQSEKKGVSALILRRLPYFIFYYCTEVIQFMILVLTCWGRRGWVWGGFPIYHCLSLTTWSFFTIILGKKWVDLFIFRRLPHFTTVLQFWQFLISVYSPPAPYGGRVHYVYIMRLLTNGVNVTFPCGLTVVLYGTALKNRLLLALTFPSSFEDYSLRLHTITPHSSTPNSSMILCTFYLHTPHTFPCFHQITNYSLYTLLLQHFFSL